MRIDNGDKFVIKIFFFCAINEQIIYANRYQYHMEFMSKCQVRDRDREKRPDGSGKEEKRARMREREK